jgi:hypothetical protein
VKAIPFDTLDKIAVRQRQAAVQFGLRSMERGVEAGYLPQQRPQH